MKGLFFFLTIMLLPTSIVAGPKSASPYRAQENREIKTLSADEISDLRAGKGMGQAKAAELNGWPGPMHVLELSDALALTAKQREETQALFDRMKANAISLGKRLVAAEAELDKLFRQRDVTAEQVRTATANIATLRGRLRAVHLTAHLEQAGVLSPEQVERYSELRGYRSPNGSHTHQH